MSLAALRSFQEVLYQSDSDVEGGSDGGEMWTVAWKVWLKIALESRVDSDEASYLPSQPFLTALVHMFPAVFQHIRQR